MERAKAEHLWYVRAPTELSWSRALWALNLLLTPAQSTGALYRHWRQPLLAY